MSTHEKQLFFLSPGLHACICSQLNAQATLLPRYDPQKQQSPGSPSQSWNVSFSLSTGIKEAWLTGSSGRGTCEKSQAPSFIYFLPHFVPKGTGVSYKNTMGFLKTDEEISEDGK